MEKVYGKRIRIDVKGDKLSTPFDNFKSRLNAIQKCIVDFINNYNSKKYTIGVDYSFYIIYHSVRDLYSGNEYKFGQDYLKNVSKDKLPIIHLTQYLQQTLLEIVLPRYITKGFTMYFRRYPGILLKGFITSLSQMNMPILMHVYWSNPI